MIICILLTVALWCNITDCGNERIIVHSDGIERIYSADDLILRNGNQSITMQYNFSQRSFIENNQTNTVTCPQPAAPAPAYVPHVQTFTERMGIYIGEYLGSPLVMGALACCAYALYYMKSKFNLYSLGKACIEKAIWSLWKSKTINADIDEQDFENTLLMHILKTYDPHNYTAAIARFLHDVEQEEELLTAYIEQAQTTQEGILRFVFEDLSVQIAQAQERLDALKKIKKVVLGWFLQPEPRGL